MEYINVAFKTMANLASIQLNTEYNPEYHHSARGRQPVPWVRTPRTFHLMHAPTVFLQPILHTFPDSIWSAAAHIQTGKNKQSKNLTLFVQCRLREANIP